MFELGMKIEVVWADAPSSYEISIMNDYFPEGIKLQSDPDQIFVIIDSTFSGSVSDVLSTIKKTLVDNKEEISRKINFPF